jgi:hypothetical protein
MHWKVPRVSRLELRRFGGHRIAPTGLTQREPNSLWVVVSMGLLKVGSHLEAQCPHAFFFGAARGVIQSSRHGVQIWRMVFGHPVPPAKPLRFTAAYWAGKALLGAPYARGRTRRNSRESSDVVLEHHLELARRPDVTLEAVFNIPVASGIWTLHSFFLDTNGGGGQPTDSAYIKTPQGSFGIPAVRILLPRTIHPARAARLTSRPKSKLGDGRLTRRILR